MRGFGERRDAGFHYFFFQAEDGIRDRLVTGVQTCALPIYTCGRAWNRGFDAIWRDWWQDVGRRCAKHCGDVVEIGRASCRERV